MHASEQPFLFNLHVFFGGNLIQLTCLNLALHNIDTYVMSILKVG